MAICQAYGCAKLIRKIKDALKVLYMIKSFSTKFRSSVQIHHIEVIVYKPSKVHLHQ